MQTFKKVTCPKCGNEKFYIYEGQCENCQFNGAVDEDNFYIYDEKIIKEKQLERVQVKHDNSCLMGKNFGAGCTLYVCTCGFKKMIPWC